MPGGERDVEDLREAAAAAWDERLRALEVDGELVDDEARTTVASHLYRLNLYPNSGHENVGTADEPRWVHASPLLPADDHTDSRTGSVIVDGKIFVNNGFWDTYRTAWPLYSLLYPRLTAELVEGFLQHYREAGWIPRWSSPGFADCMVGTSSDIAFADALVKDVEVDAETAYLAAVRNATVATDDTRVGRKSLDSAIFLGWTPVEEPEGLSWSIDGYINDYGIASMARWLLDHDRLPDGYDRTRLTDELRWFTARATDYARLFRPDWRMFHGRRADGAWRVEHDFDPDDWGDDYTETNAWNMAVSVPHDGAGLAGLHGSRDQLGTMLETIFSRPETGRHEGSYPRRHARDHRGPRCPDGDVRAQQPARAPSAVPVAARRTAGSYAGSRSRDHASLPPGQRDRPGLRRRRGQRRDVGLAPVRRPGDLPDRRRQSCLRPVVAPVRTCPRAPR